MKDKFGIFYVHFIYKKTQFKFQNIKHFRVVLMSFKDTKWMKDIFRIFYSHFFVRTT